MVWTCIKKEFKHTKPNTVRQAKTEELIKKVTIGEKITVTKPQVECKKLGQP